jgi:hypothetical protein
MNDAIEKKGIKGLYDKLFSKSLFFMIFGNFFIKKNNSAGLLAIILVGTICYVIVYKLCYTKEIEKEIGILSNIVFVVIGYYFGAPKGTIKSEDDE